MNKREIKSIIESILFAWGEPLHINELVNILGINKKELREIIKEMQKEIEHYRRGIIINIYDDNLQMSTRIEHNKYISELVKTSNRKLNNSTMEVLAIIAYNQPITRIEIDSIRGVKSSSSVETLKSKQLIKEVGKLDAVGKPILYGTTVEFLRAFNISSLNELPNIEGLDNIEKLLDSEDEN